MHTKYLDAIKGFEGFSAQAKWDYAQSTNGYGTRARHIGERISPDEAERRFQTEIAEARKLVERHAPDADDGTKAALTSLTFNAGDKWARSGLGDAVRRHDLDTARSLFLQYNKAGGNVLPGLVRRRSEEAAWIGAGGAAAAHVPAWGTEIMQTPHQSSTAAQAESPAVPAEPKVPVASVTDPRPADEVSGLLRESALRAWIILAAMHARTGVSIR